MTLNLRKRLGFLLLAVGTAIIVSSVFCAPKRKAPAPRVYDPWLLTASTPEANYPPYLGNGFIGARIGPEGWGSSSGKASHAFMAGLYNGETLVELPHWSVIRILDSGGRFIIDEGLPYHQTLNLRLGSVRTRYSMRRGRSVIDVDAESYVSRARPGLALTRFTIRPRADAKLKVQHGRGAIPKGLVSDGYGWRTKDGSNRVAMLDKFISPLGSTAENRLKKGRGYTFHLYTAVARTGRFEDPYRQARYQMKSALTIGARRLIAEHEDAWRKLWTADIKIEGDPEAQQVVHSCMFYLLQSTGKGMDWSIPPTGLSALAWNGHVFWDADIWMLPALLPQHPKFAKTIVDYRFKTLSGARMNAIRRGLSGVEYAWESARTGREAIGRPFSEERHITSDVAIAQWQYYLATGDKTWLRRFGYPVIRETANYWVSRVKYNQAKKRYEFLRVVPPDETAEIVDNSVYTNAAAKRDLEIAIETRRVLGKQSPYIWRKVAGAMYLPFDKKNARYIEYDGYPGDKSKQADTELLIYPLGLAMPRKVVERTFDYYKVRVHPKGPAMSSSVHAVIAARLGRRDEAYAHFVKSYKPYLKGPFNMFNEKPSDFIDNTCFLTGAGGVLQAAIYGFGGLRYNETKIEATPILPKKWKRLTITGVQWHGKSHELVVEPKGYRLRRVSQAVTSKKLPKISLSVQSPH